MKMVTIGLVIVIIGVALMIVGYTIYEGNKTETTDEQHTLVVRDMDTAVKKEKIFYVTAGCNQVIFLPGNVCELSGDVFSDYGTMVVGDMWVKVSGPTGGSFDSPVMRRTLFRGMNVAGIYVFRYRATNQWGVTASAMVMVEVRPFPTLVSPYNQ